MYHRVAGHMRPAVATICCRATFAAMLVWSSVAHGAPTRLVKARQSPYQVSRQSGNVLRWDSQGAKWLAVVKGDRIPVDSLVQVARASSLTISAPQTEASIGAVEGDKVVMTIRDPLVFRLNRNLFRQTIVGQGFLSKSDANLLAELAKTIKEQEKDDFASIWHRQLAILGQYMPMAAKSLGDATAPAADVSVLSKPIRLITPVENVAVIARSFPTDVRLNWEIDDDAELRYFIYVWKSGDDMGDPVAVTRAKTHNITMKVSGRYFLRLTSSDGRYQSLVREFIVATPDAIKLTDRDATKESRLVGKRIKPLAPVNGLRWLVKGKKTTVRFDWTMERSLENSPNQSFRLVIRNLKGRQVAAVTTDQFSASFKLNSPGRYFWQVSRVNPPVAKQGAQLEELSDERTFELQEEGAVFATQLASLVKESFAEPRELPSGDHTRIYFGGDQ